MHLFVSKMSLFTHANLCGIVVHSDRQQIECMTLNHLLALVVIHQSSQEHDYAGHCILQYACVVIFSCMMVCCLIDCFME